MTATRLVGVWSDGGEPAPGVPVSTATPIDWPRGSTSNIEIQLVDQDGQPFDIDLLIGGNDLVLTVRQDVGSDPLLSLNAAHTGAPGAYVWTLTSGMTIDLNGRLVYDVWGTRDGAQRQVVATSYFNIVFRIRR